LSYAHKIVPHPDCIIFGGDITPVGPEHDEEIVRSLFENVTHMLAAVYPRVPFYPVIGNHELFKDQGTLTHDQRDFKAMSRGLANLTDAERTTFERGGYYYRDFQNFRFLFLNTLYREGETPDLDPWGQFAWMDSVCAEARASGMTIGAVAHAASGGVAPKERKKTSTKWISALHSRFTKYDIRFMLAGHGHRDRLLWTANASDPRFFLITPAVATFTGSKIGFRVYRIARVGILNYQQYSADEFPQSGDKFPWKLEYDFRQTYNTSDASPGSLMTVAGLVQENNELRMKRRG
jgi:hypothetical protein